MRRLAFALAGFGLLGLLEAAHNAFYFHNLGRPFSLLNVVVREVAPWIACALCVPLVARWGARFALEWPPRARALLAHLAGVAAAALLLASVRVALERALGTTSPAAPPQPLWIHFRNSLVYSAAQAVIVYGGALFLGSAAAWAERSRQLLALQAELSKAQLSALRMQLNPHFFFNTLHTIGALVREGDRRGSVELIEKLGDVLRHVLRPEAQADAPLEVELAFLRKYLEIEQARFGDRLRVEWQVDASSAAVPVPQLLLQPLVENALKHGLSRRAQPGSLTIRARVEGAQLEMLVVDDGVGLPADFATAQPRGIGLDNVRARLQHRYGEAARLSLTTGAAGGVTARIVLPLPPRASA